MTYYLSNQWKSMLCCISQSPRLPRMCALSVNKCLLYKRKSQSKGRKSKMTDIKLDLFLKKGHRFGDKFLTEERFEIERGKSQINEFIDEVKPLSNPSERVESGDLLFSISPSVR